MSKTPNVRRARASVIALAGAVAGIALAAAPTQPAGAAGRGGGEGQVVVAAAGDIACSPHDEAFNGGAGTPDECAQGRTSDVLLAIDPDAVLALGDTQYVSGSLSSYLASYDPSWGRVKDITFPTPGNHEYYTPGAAGYFDYFNGVGVTSGRAGERGAGFYSVDLGAWHVVALNSNCAQIGGCGPGSPQQRWLRSDLRQSERPCLLAFWHHPLFSSGQHGASPQMRPAYRRLDRAGADVVLAGHEHDYERFAPQRAGGAASRRSPRAFVVGTGGAAHRPFAGVAPNSAVRASGTFGVLRLALRAHGYRWRFVPVAGGGFIDAGRGSC